MSSQNGTKPWDLSLVLELNKQFSWTGPEHSGAAPPQAAKQTEESRENIATNDFAIDNSGLGNFGKVWSLLGVPLRSPSPEQQPLPPPSAQEQKRKEEELPRKQDYASDGAAYAKPSSKARTVQWADDTSGGEQSADTSEVLSAATLTKKQLKKQRKRERKKREAAEAIKNATVSESEADVFTLKAPAKKAGRHGPECSATKTPVLSTKKQPHPPTTPTKPRTHSTSKGVGINGSPQQLPLPKTSAANAALLIPSTVKPPNNRVAKVLFSTPQKQPQQQLAKQQSAATPATTTPKKAKPTTIEPIVVRSGEDRDFALLMKLINGFWEDRKYLVSPMNLTTHNNDPMGIHVFVDASNIFIGFNEQLKRARGIPLNYHLPQAGLSFDALALLMERRRPVAKRVLVGSTPHQAAFDKAKAVGYETSILEKVFKQRELTERQKFFKAVDSGTVRRGAKAPPANNVASAVWGTDAGIDGSPGPTATATTSSNGQHHTSSGSETTTKPPTPPQFAPAKMIEQGVDEILHLKILQSIVDADGPATMVLATGDAAAAEYSDGFMAMAERALKKGWTVELVSWSANISSMYRRRRWVDTWADRFRVIELDDYAEELLEM